MLCLGGLKGLFDAFSWRKGCCFQVLNEVRYAQMELGHVSKIVEEQLSDCNEALEQENILRLITRKVSHAVGLGRGASFPEAVLPRTQPRAVNWLCAWLAHLRIRSGMPDSMSE